MMQPHDDVWQGCFGYWQNQFIQQNFLLLGYLAWNGYLKMGRGMVVCTVADTIPSCIDWKVDTLTYQKVFIPQAQVEAYLQVLELQPEVATTLRKAINTYVPTSAIVLLVVGNGVVDINLLENLKISPADCYEQVQHRWAEFEAE
ncbi:MAG: hypothetical protein AB4058_21015 [Microcystaceae cyanobacterium]